MKVQQHESPGQTPVTFSSKIDLSSSVTERFLRYIRLNTQADRGSDNFPSSPNQLKFGEIIVKELSEAGVKEIKQDEFGYVIATVPANSDKKVPTILLTAHLDTSPDCEGKDIIPVIHKNYNGNEIILPGNTAMVINSKDFPDLSNKIGMDIITSDGTTILGADNKAGVAELIEAAALLIKNPQIKHGKIILLFVPDEEIGKDVLNLNVKDLSADYAYTIDGHNCGSINNETFCIGTVTLEIHGNPMHTGAGNGLMENSIRIATDVINNLHPSVFPELSHDRNGFIHVSAIEGKMSYSKIIFQVRAFTEEEVTTLANILKRTTERVMENFLKSTFSFSFEITDKNIINVLKKFPFVTELAAEAMRRAGLNPKIEPLRGATTGTGLSYKGLPTANIFTGQHGNHSKMEWICVQDMQKAVESILHLCEVWHEKGENYTDASSSLR